jgi:hypothetical protein
MNNIATSLALMAAAFNACDPGMQLPLRGLGNHPRSRKSTRKPHQGATRCFGLRARRHIAKYTKNRQGQVVRNPEYVTLRMHQLGNMRSVAADGLPMPITLDPDYRRAKNALKRQRRAQRAA